MVDKISMLLLLLLLLFVVGCSDTITPKNEVHTSKSDVVVRTQVVFEYLDSLDEDKCVDFSGFSACRVSSGDLYFANGSVSNFEEREDD